MSEHAKFHVQYAKILSTYIIWVIADILERLSDERKKKKPNQVLMES